MRLNVDPFKRHLRKEDEDERDKGEDRRDDPFKRHSKRENEDKRDKGEDRKDDEEEDEDDVEKDSYEAINFCYH
ncbi:hypothetical protein VNO77_18927 [Canavalia gladiata]|uniref:Uncharacterized protein n=1 Tax=Canavalia gladiata TaxID=3824 RepID=A0AAN9LMF9_CANGL